MWQTVKGHTILCNEVKSINADSSPRPEVYNALLFLGMSSSLATTDILYPSSKGALIGLWVALFDFRYWVWKFVEETFGRELASEEEVPWKSAWNRSGCTMKLFNSKATSGSSADVDPEIKLKWLMDLLL